MPSGNRLARALGPSADPLLCCYGGTGSPAAPLRQECLDHTASDEEPIIATRRSGARTLTLFHPSRPGSGAVEVRATSAGLVADDHGLPSIGRDKVPVRLPYPLRS